MQGQRTTMDGGGSFTTGLGPSIRRKGRAFAEGMTDGRGGEGLKKQVLVGSPFCCLSYTNHYSKNSKLSVVCCRFDKSSREVDFTVTVRKLFLEFSFVARGEEEEEERRRGG